MKRYDKYIGKTIWIVKRYGKYGRKASRIGKRCGQYGRKQVEKWKVMENTEEK